ncbi:MAG: hypothetical protein ACP5O1_09135, partial [Phycisphaerae bacterium]
THKCEKTHLTNCNTTTYVKYAAGTSVAGFDRLFAKWRLPSQANTLVVSGSTAHATMFFGYKAHLRDAGRTGTIMLSLLSG